MSILALLAPTALTQINGYSARSPALHAQEQERSNVSYCALTLKNPLPNKQNVQRSPSLPKIQNRVRGVAAALVAMAATIKAIGKRTSRIKKVGIDKFILALAQLFAAADH